MIELKNGFSRQRVYASDISLLDFVIPATYQHFEGDNIPPFYKKTVRHTNVIDLTQDMDTILGKMKSNTRNEVRRGEREGIICEYSEGLSEFVPFYNAFAKEKWIMEKRLTA